MLAAGPEAAIKAFSPSSDLSSDEEQDECMPKDARNYRTLKTTKQDVSSPHRASPSKRSASQMSNLAVSQRKAAREGNLRRIEGQTSVGGGGGGSSSSSSSSSSSEGDGNDDSFEVTPKRKKETKTSYKRIGSDKQSDRIVPAKKQDNPYRSGEKEREEPYEDCSEALRQSQQDSQARLAEMDRQLGLTASSEFGSSGASVPVRAKDLKTCPFCYEPMPKSMTKALQALMQPWLDQYHQKRRIGATSTVEACQRHRDEARTIPEGKLMGWRTNLDEDKLKALVKQEKNPFMSRMRERIENPMSSEWFQRIIAARKRYGRQAESTSVQMQNINEMQAGYFGEQGWEILLNILNEAFTEGAEPLYDLNQLAAVPDGPLQGLTAFVFIERVLLPELILMLIIRDRKARDGVISMEQAKAIRDASADYGIAMFPSKALGMASNGRSAFGDNKNGKSPSTSADKKGSGSLRQSKTDKRPVKQSAHSPAGSPIKRPSARSLSNSPAASITTSQPVPRPRPRPAARKPVSEVTLATCETTCAPVSSLTVDSSLDSPSGATPSNAIILSPNKPFIEGPISITSSLESQVSQASQESTIISSHFDTPTSSSSKDFIRQWRSSGARPGYI